jgi:hypothetical protein
VKYEGPFICVSYIRKYFENLIKMYYESCKNNHPVFIHVLSKTNLFCYNQPDAHMFYFVI